MTNYSESDLIHAVRRHALDNYEIDGDILERISDAKAQTPAAAVKACERWVKLYDEQRRAIRSEAF